MKIRITEKTTEIEADARELRECNTLGDNFLGMINRCFQNHEPFDDDYDETDDEEENDE